MSGKPAAKGATWVARGRGPPVMLDWSPGLTGTRYHDLLVYVQPAAGQGVKAVVSTVAAALAGVSGLGPADFRLADKGIDPSQHAGLLVLRVAVPAARVKGVDASLWSPQRLGQLAVPGVAHGVAAAVWAPQHECQRLFRVINVPTDLEADAIAACLAAVPGVRVMHCARPRVFGSPMEAANMVELVVQAAEAAVPEHIDLRLPDGGRLKMRLDRALNLPGKAGPGGFGFTGLGRGARGGAGFTSFSPPTSATQHPPPSQSPAPSSSKSQKKKKQSEESRSVPAISSSSGAASPVGAGPPETAAEPPAVSLAGGEPAGVVSADTAGVLPALVDEQPTAPAAAEEAAAALCDMVRAADGAAAGGLALVLLATGGDAEDPQPERAQHLQQPASQPAGVASEEGAVGPVAPEAVVVTPPRPPSPTYAEVVAGDGAPRLARTPASAGSLGVVATAVAAARPMETAGWTAVVGHKRKEAQRPSMGAASPDQRSRSCSPGASASRGGSRIKAARHSLTEIHSGSPHAEAGGDGQ